MTILLKVLYNIIILIIFIDYIPLLSVVKVIELGSYHSTIDAGKLVDTCGGSEKGNGRKNQWLGLVK